MTRRSAIKISISTAIAVTLVLYLWTLSTNKSLIESEDEVLSASPSVIPDFAQYENVTDKKKAFFTYLIPAIEKQNSQILAQRLEIKMIRREFLQTSQLPARQQEAIIGLAKSYRVNGNLKPDSDDDWLTLLDSLLKHVDIIPLDLVLVQAANESAWGTSRFARQGYNFFGLWCFQKGCGFVPSKRNDNATHEVAKFENLDEAVESYMHNLNRHQAYSQLRAVRSRLRENQLSINGMSLAEGLLSYSERGQAYVEELQAMIRVNKKHWQ